MGLHRENFPDTPLATTPLNSLPFSLLFCPSGIVYTGLPVHFLSVSPLGRKHFKGSTFVLFIVEPHSKNHAWHIVGLQKNLLEE